MESPRHLYLKPRVKFQSGAVRSGQWTCGGADAVMVVPSGVSTDHVTYAPTLTMSGTVDIYGSIEKTASGVLAIFPCSRITHTLRA